jgi:hypothetical protein
MDTNICEKSNQCLSNQCRGGCSRSAYENTDYCLTDYFAVLLAIPRSRSKFGPLARHAHYICVNLRPSAVEMLAFAVTTALETRAPSLWG